MRPAFRSRAAMLSWAAGLLLLLALPVLLSLIGLAPRAEAYKTIGTNAGTVGAVLRDLYSTNGNTDIVFLGSSLVEAGIDREMIATGLGIKGSDPAKVAVLALNWPGLDQQYYLLRDYLEQHDTRLILWNLPEPHSRAYDSPHVQSYRWIRYGEYSDALDGLPLSYRMSLYGEMVLGAPRQLLSIIRPNIQGPEGMQVEAALRHGGYGHNPFVPDNPALSSTAHLLPLDARELQVTGPAPGRYQMHFGRQIVALAKKHHCGIVLLHMPIDAEYGDTHIPELADWQALGVKQMIAIPSAELFPGFDKPRFLHFYRDTHLNQNGARLFTRSIVPAVREAYEEASAAR